MIKFNNILSFVSYPEKGVFNMHMKYIFLRCSKLYSIKTNLRKASR